MSRQNKHQFLNEALNARREDHRLRSLRGVEPHDRGGLITIGNKTLVNFCSNDYLGLSRHPKVIATSQDYLTKYGAGATASRLVSGSFNIHQELENKLAATFNADAALLFNTGFQANTTILSALSNRNSLILADKKVHNSLLQGALLSRSQLKRFEHNDHDHLEYFLKKGREEGHDRIWIITETVFSMDGDRNKLDDLIELSRKYDALLYSDDAHALGVLGERGLGLNYGKDGIDLSLGTFGKAFGSFGAFVACSQDMKDFLINFCPGFIYTTALPPSVIGALDAGLDLIPEMEEERKHLFEMVRHFKEAVHKLGYDTGTSDSQIIPVIVGDEQKTLKLSEKLEKEGFYAAAIRPPTVPKGGSRIRITLTSSHTMKQVNALVEALGTHA